ncbi:Potassium channel [Orbilia ellipsospora]|uniref:Potassium channel n=1 Tax=Orbilia ellipsospora TaxID=2528407 RepID=A0AAV9XK77_9PEZI
MNDPGLDDSVKQLAEAQQKQTPSPNNHSGRFLSPDLHRTSSPRHNSGSSNSTNAADSIASNNKGTPTGIAGGGKHYRKSCFWERFSHDSREDEGEENARRSRNGVSGDTGSVDSTSPMREVEEVEAGVGLEEGHVDSGERDMQELNEMEKKGEADEHLPAFSFLFSTVFPLMSATLGPVANVMSVCALVAPWRVYIPNKPGASAEHSDKISDPAWALAINGISLACGFAANVILLLNLAWSPTTQTNGKSYIRRKFQSNHLLPFTITLWYTASVLLLSLLAVYRTHLYNLPREHYAWSQAFYYGVNAATLYFIIATLLVANYIGVITNRYARQFTLTIAQRTLMLQTMSLMVWLCLGAGVFAKLEGWAFLDGIYFCDTTFLVVGLGDYSLTTNAGRALLFPYAAVGIVIVGLIVSSIRGLVLERGKKKVKRRLLWKQREIMVDGDGKGVAEAEKAESEKERFELMREVQDKADQRRKWMALCVSLTFFLVFWLLGACVFMEAQHEKEWTYFQSLYFCFTTILTIGYGDFYPTSNSGKPFFVIWSLLAVPMMTILVSNLGDTIIVMIKNITLWLGEWTILPEEKISELGGKNRWLKSQRHRNKHARRQRSSELREKREQEQRNQQHYEGEMDMGDSTDDEEVRQLQRIGTDLIGKEGREEGQKYGGDNGMAFLHHDLAFAIQELLPDLASKPPKQYNFEEWTTYLKLINAPDGKSKSRHVSSPRIKMADGEDEETDWLGEDSPLMSRQSETEWLLSRLCGRLEECLREQKQSARRRSRSGKGRHRAGGALAGQGVGWPELAGEKQS